MRNNSQITTIKPVKTLGITGDIGAGKSYLANVLKSLGMPLFDTDSQAKALYDSDSELKAFMIARFGKHLYETEDGLLNRSLLASIIFSDEKALKEVEREVHHRTLEAFTTWRNELATPYCALESALLAKIPRLLAMCDAVVQVVAPKELRIKRVLQRSGSSKAEIEKRIALQESTHTRIDTKHLLTIVNDGETPILPQAIKNSKLASRALEILVKTILDAFTTFSPMQILTELAVAIADSINKLYGTTLSSDAITLQETRSEFRGDYTYVVFPILKASHKKPLDTARELGEALVANCPYVKSYEAVNGFLNLELADDQLLAMLDEVSSKDQFGHRQAEASAATYMIEYSSPNTNKPLHLGHIRNNLLGYSLSRIVEANGFRVVKTNIVNDRGIHICKSMVAWQRWGEGATPQSTGKKGDHLVGDFYVLFDKHYKEEVKNLVASGVGEEQAKEEAPLMLEARKMLRQWEAGDPDTLALWKTMNSWVYEGFDTSYKQLGVDFDKIYYESDTYKVGREEVLRGLEKGIFVKHSDGSVWADLTNEGLDEKILLRSDGTSVYITQDIGTAKMRYADYPIDKMIYVVGNEQEYHFQVLSILLDKLGFAFGKDLVHFSYGMVNLPEGRMKSREGTVVDADDLMAEMIDNAYSIGEEAGRSSDLPEEEKLEIARRVGLGALKYFILKVDPRKNMTFNPKESIDFNGHTAAFIQYTYARIRSLEAKATALPSADTTHSHFELMPIERTIVRTLYSYPQIVRQAFDDFSPAVVANYVYELVKQYNSFYHDCPILREENSSLQSFRLKLSTAVAKVVSQGMWLLGIEMPERM